MKNHKSKLAAILFLLGLIGIFSILTMEIPIPEEAKEKLLQHLTLEQIKWLALINPTFLLIGALTFGTLLYDKVKLRVPIIEGLLQKKETHFVDVVKSGVVGGVIAGILITIIASIFTPFLPQEFIELGENLRPSLAARFLYGGLTEEILMRFGLMTLVVWITYQVVGRLTNKVYWIGILIAAFIFALGHFPIVFNILGNPSALLLVFILIGNLSAGIIFGYMYWKKGLESAFIAHIFAHIVMLVGESLLGTV